MKNTKSPEETETEIAKVHYIADTEGREASTMFWFDKKYNWWEDQKLLRFLKNQKNDRQMGQLCFTCSNVSHSVTEKRNYLFMSTKETDNTGIFSLSV